MRIDDLNYELPEELVARHPTERRDRSRLLVLAEEAPADHRFDDLPSLLPEGALLVVNDTRVIPARLVGQKATGGRLELLLVERRKRGAAGEERWQAMIKTSKRVQPGLVADVADGMGCQVETGPNDEGLFLVTLRPPAGQTVDEMIGRHGHVPLPPYLGREDEPEDRERYQTIFAREPGAVAAPTAGLHFTPEVIAALRARGCHVASVTLHVGPGTFKPVKVEDLNDHPMHRERYVVPEATALAIAEARRRDRPVVAVGTTVVRSLESAADRERPGEVRAEAAETGLLIQPGYRFSVVDALITNFHLPRSTLLALVYAFGGVEAVARAYQAAVERRYRFYSYGDAMFLPRCVASVRERGVPS